MTAIVPRKNDVVSGFAKSALSAKQIGFDGIAVHGASGYLIDSFLWPLTNRRSDSYGGDMANRVRFPAEIVAAIRAAVGPDMPIMFRFGQWKNQDFNAHIAATPDELSIMLGALGDAGTDIFDASTIYFSKPAFEGSSLSLAGWTKKLSGKAAMAVGGIGLADGLFSSLHSGGASIERNYFDAADRIDNGEFDMLGIGRALLADAQWPTKIRSGEPTEPFDRDRHLRELI